MAYHRAGGDGFKGLTTENWLERDGAARRFLRLGDGSVASITAKQWAENFMGPALERAVSPEIRELFEKARAAFCYGFFFSPLYILGGEQLGQALDTALQQRCAALKAPRKRTLAAKIAWLQARGVIKGERTKDWEAARALHAIVARPDKEDASAPPSAARYLKIAAVLINELYSVTILNTEDRPEDQTRAS
jgi:hypothetical protein